MGQSKYTGSRRGLAMAEVLVGTAIGVIALGAFYVAYVSLLSSSNASASAGAVMSSMNLVFKATSNANSCTGLFIGLDSKPAVFDFSQPKLELQQLAIPNINPAKNNVLIQKDQVFGDVRIKSIFLNALRPKAGTLTLSGLTLDESLMSLEVNVTSIKAGAAVPLPSALKSLHTVYTDHSSGRIITCNYTSTNKTPTLAAACTESGGVLSSTTNACDFPGVSFGGVFNLNETGYCTDPNQLLDPPACGCPPGFTDVNADDGTIVDETCVNDTAHSAQYNNCLALFGAHQSKKKWLHYCYKKNVTLGGP